MATGQPAPAGDQTPTAPSPRVRLAQLAAEAARAIPGVADLDSGPSGLFATVGGATRVAGVTCASAPGGGFDVSLRLVCELTATTDLTAVGEAVRAAVRREADGAGVDVQTVTVEVADVVDAAAPSTGTRS